jgi:hypothetical protein
MSISKARFPVKCPVCGTESLGEFLSKHVVRALSGPHDPIRLHAACHDQWWNASEIEIEQIREYLGEVWLRENREA